MAGKTDTGKESVHFGNDHPLQEDPSFQRIAGPTACATEISQKQQGHVAATSLD